MVDPYFVWCNHALAKSLGLDQGVFDDPDVLSVLAGNSMPAGLDSIALAYAGHQFGRYVPQLGDGRAVMLGEVVDQQQFHWDIQLKGSGPTRFSRGGDGRAPLAAMLREAVISEAMHGLGIPSTRTLAVVGGEQTVYRAEGPVPAGVLTRVAAGHLRVGSFQYAAAHHEPDSLQALADYAIRRHFPTLVDTKSPYLAFFETVLERQARLMAQWMGVGFIHGVMNTDNMSITGETIDYGPCAFMDEFSWNQVYSSIDVQGRYAYGNQAGIAYWNCAQLAEALEPLLQNDDTAAVKTLYEILETFPAKFQKHWLQTLGAKLGIIHPKAEDAVHFQAFLALLQDMNADFTNNFRRLSTLLDSATAQKEWLQQLGDTVTAQAWLQQWLLRVQGQALPLETIQQRMQQVNPAYIPRNHWVEKAIIAMVEQKDSSIMDQLLLLLRSPYIEQSGCEPFQQLPEESDRVHQTFCGT